MIMNRLKGPTLHLQGPASANLHCSMLGKALSNSSLILSYAGTSDMHPPLSTAPVLHVKCCFWLPDIF